MRTKTTLTSKRANAPRAQRKKRASSAAPRIGTQTASKSTHGSGLPIAFPFPPMEARSVDDIPQGKGWVYEPKWDGFRALVARTGDSVELQSKSGQSLTRYFPELVAAVRDLRTSRFVLDGEIVVPIDGRLSFDQLLLRIHPAESRIRKLAADHPSMLTVFDLLVDRNGESLIDRPLAERRKRLEHLAEAVFPAGGRIRLSPSTVDYKQAVRWLNSAGANLDGVIAKRVDLPYTAGERSAMQKIKRIRSADCVVGGFRYGTNEKIVGSLLLGLYDAEGLLNHVGFTSNLPRDVRKSLTPRLEALISQPGFTGRAPGGPSRWSNKRSTEWEPLKTKLVVEVEYDHFTAGRFRHGTSFIRWRPDKAPRQCAIDQVAQSGQELAAILRD